MVQKVDKDRSCTVGKLIIGYISYMSARVASGVSCVSKPFLLGIGYKCYPCDASDLRLLDWNLGI